MQGTGDVVRVIERPAHGLAIRYVFRICTSDRMKSGGCFQFRECPAILGGVNRGAEPQMRGSIILW
jgi:hypothetical protein